MSRENAFRVVHVIKYYPYRSFVFRKDMCHVFKGSAAWDAFLHIFFLKWMTEFRDSFIENLKKFYFNCFINLWTDLYCLGQNSERIFSVQAGNAKWLKHRPILKLFPIPDRMVKQTISRYYPFIWDTVRYCWKSEGRKTLCYLPFYTV